MRVFVKDPSARIDYRIDWGAGHLGNNIIRSSTWTVSPQHENAIFAAVSSHDGKITTVTLDGGVAGRVYDVRNQVVLENGERDERSISFRVEKR